MRKVIIDKPVSLFNGSEITGQAGEGMKMDMTTYMSSIQPIYAEIKHKANKSDKSNKEKVTTFRKLPGDLTWLGTSVLL